MSPHTLFTRPFGLRRRVLRALALGVAVQLAACDAQPASEPAEDGGETPDARNDAAEPEPDGGLEAEFMGCPDTLPPFALGMQALGRAGHIRATLVEASPAPPRRYLNDWVIELGHADGTPLDDVRIVNARPWMAVHGHDGNIAPVVHAQEETGRFAIDKLNLFMRGAWEIQLKLSSPSVGDDDVVFEVCIPE